MCFQVCWPVLLLHLPGERCGAAACCQHCHAPRKSFSVRWIPASGRWRILVCINSSYFIIITYPIMNCIHYLFYYYKVLCSLGKYIWFSNSDLDCWLCFPREEESLFWESIYPPSEESPKAWDPNAVLLRCTKWGKCHWWLFPWAELKMSNKIWGTQPGKGWICLLSHPGLLFALSHRRC